jgi:thioredoxin 1
MKTAQRSCRNVCWSAAAVLASLLAGCFGHSGLIYPWAQTPDASDTLEHVSSATFDARVLKCDQPVVVDFFGKWCKPCASLGPILADFAKEHPEVRVVKVDVDDSHDLAVRYGVEKLPTLFVFRNGHAVTQSIGVVTKEEMAKMVRTGGA